MTSLYEQLTTLYGKPVQRTATHCENGTSVKRFKIDDETASDHYDGFCRMYVNISDLTDMLALELRNAPHNGAVTALVQSMGGEIDACPWAATISVRLSRNDAAFVMKLARAIRRTMARGQRYLEPNWKWIAPRTADALERFARCLRKKQLRRGTSINDDHRS